MRAGIIIQARMGSSRLPGKVMMRLAGRTILEHVLRRCARIEGIECVVCAVPDRSESAPLEEVARTCGARVSRGSETDVLVRYLGAARENALDVIMRVTSDCPLIDPGICGEVLRLRAGASADYACNNMPKTFPHGLDCEAMTLDALSAAADTTAEANDREHVTPWLRRAPHLKRANLSSGRSDLSHHRWTLDYPEDLTFFEALYPVLEDGDRAGMSDVLAAVQAHPEIAALNEKWTSTAIEASPAPQSGRIA